MSPAYRTVLLEALEPRLAPAGVLPLDSFKAVTAGSSISLEAGQGLSTANGGGSLLLYVEQGKAIVYTTDLNADSKVDFNEITGIAAGDGLKLIAFTDINGDIVTNLKKDGHLTDSDGNASNGYDGKIVLNSRIESIVLRSVTADDLNLDVAGNTVQTRLAKSQYSIFGNIYAGGLGRADGTGLFIDPSGFTEQAIKFGARQTLNEGGTPVPEVGFVFTGSAVGGHSFSFGTAPDYGDGPAKSLRGTLAAFIPAAGQSGGDVIGIRAGQLDVESGSFTPAAWHFGGIETGKGGFGARGGNITDINIYGDIGGLLLKTGSGGVGEVGGSGGSISGLAIAESLNSKVEISTGNGGTGLSGPAGLAGTVSFAGTAQLTGNITVGLGKGGDAFGNGGKGTSITDATIENLDPGDYLPAQFVSTWRMPGDIGDQYLVNPADPTQGYATRQIDFDGNGSNDAVVLTDVTDQLFVSFDGDARREYLPSPAFAAAAERNSAVVVLDVNGDGHPDIVTASSSGDGYSGVLTYINRFDPVTDQWLGFDVPRYSPLPNYWADAGFASNARNGYTPQAVINLVGGDFDHNGTTDLGVISMGYFNVADGLPPYYAVLSVMKGLPGSDGNATGYFAADFGKGTGYARTKEPIVALGGARLGQYNSDFSFRLKATSAVAGDEATDLILGVSRGGVTGDSVTEGAFGRGTVLATFSTDVDGNVSADSAPLTYTERVTEDVTINDVSVNRWVGYGAQFGIRAADFVVMDVDNNGFFDAVVVGQPTGSIPGKTTPSFLVAATLEGAVDGSIKQDPQQDNGPRPPYWTSGLPASYSGIALTESSESTPPVDSVLGTDYTDVPALRMVAGDFDGNRTTAEFMLDAVFPGAIGAQTTGVTFQVTGFGQYNNEFTELDQSFGYTRIGDVESPFRDALFGYFDGSTAGLVITLDPDGVRWVVDLFSRPIASSSLSLTAGAGGLSLLGTGGTGGGIGNGLFGGLDAVSSAVIPSSISVSGFSRISLNSGAGGFGLAGGGFSGNIWGISAASNIVGNVSMSTADAGSSLFGAGGNAGSISQFYANAGLATTFSAGDGGFGGTRGGAGGSVLGRGDASALLLADVDSIYASASGGNGGFGMGPGGAGGRVINLVAVINEPTNTSLLFEQVSSQGGRGGDSAAAVAGAGGDVWVQPSPLLNELNGPLILTGGDGGNGLTGGAGGSVRDFRSIPTEPLSPDYAKISAGNGGQGVTGNGGKGGGISGFQSSADNSAGELSYLLAGAGGLSSGATGGDGGSIISSVLTSQAGAVAAIAGAGGNGLRSGGVGGALTTLTLNSGGLENARVLGFAGKGGDAYGVSSKTVLAEKVQPFATSVSSLYQRSLFTMGPSNGIGGTGGSINNFKQPQAEQASVDLMAGNGGSTISWGTVVGSTGVGKGGSISNVNLAGSAGKLDANVAIRAYRADFADAVRSGAVAKITDDTGNIGVVVGAAGRVRNDQPASSGVAGSVNSFKASNIMSMVAGSVDRVAAITSISGLQLQNGGTQIGAAKNAYLNPNLNDGVVYTFDPANPVPRPYPETYYAPPASDPNVVPRYAFAPSLNRGGQLVDGAILTSSYASTNPFSARVYIV